MAAMQTTEIKRYALTQQPAVRDHVIAVIALYDAAGKPIANVNFVRDGALPKPAQDNTGAVVLHLWDTAYPNVVAMLRSGAQVFFNWDGHTGSISTAVQAVG